MQRTDSKVALSDHDFGVNDMLGEAKVYVYLCRSTTRVRGNS